MFLTGPDSKRPGSYAVERTKELLETALQAAPHLATFDTWKGVIVCGDWATATQQLRSKKPLLVLEVGDVRQDDDAVINDGKRYLVEISIEAVTGLYCAGAESLLKDALVSILESSEAALDALALEESEIRSGQGLNENPARINPHTLSLAVHCVN